MRFFLFLHPPGHLSLLLACLQDCDEKSNTESVSQTRRQMASRSLQRRRQENGREEIHRSGGGQRSPLGRREKTEVRQRRGSARSGRTARRRRLEFPSRRLSFRRRRRRRRQRRTISVQISFRLVSFWTQLVERERS